MTFSGASRWRSLNHETWMFLSKALAALASLALSVSVLAFKRNERVTPKDSFGSCLLWIWALRTERSLGLVAAMTAPSPKWTRLRQAFVSAASERRAGSGRSLRFRRRSALAHSVDLTVSRISIVVVSDTLGIALSLVRTNFFSASTSRARTFST